MAPPLEISPSEQWNCQLFANNVQNLAGSLISSEGSVLYEVVQPAEEVKSTTTTTTTTNNGGSGSPGGGGGDGKKKIKI